MRSLNGKFETASMGRRNARVFKDFVKMAERLAGFAKGQAVPIGAVWPVRDG
jgi:hypothetical protein